IPPLLASLEDDLRGADEAEASEIAQRIADLHDELDAFEERYGRHRTEEILAGLGFSEATWDRPVSELSGGAQMRAAPAGPPPPGPGSPPPRRADNPPRRAAAGVVRRLPPPLPQGAPPRQPRPPVPRPPDRARPVVRARGAAVLRRRLRGLPAPARRGGREPRAARQAAGRPARRDRALHRALPLQGDEGAPGPEPRQPARQGAGRPGTRPPQDGALPLPRGGAVRPRGRAPRGRPQGVRRQRRLPRPR